ncbi:MAG: type II toxin-antitoxin system VapC family toxin [Candidatus Bathyarchaeia archaeon]
MAYAKRNQKYLGIDSNVLIAYLDREHPQHDEVKWLTSRKVALNPTVIHETYHGLVFKLKWSAREAAQVLRAAVDDEDILFLNQTKVTTRTGLRIGHTYGLGGRDALILASFLDPSVPEMLSFDKALITVGKIADGRRMLRIRKP